MTLSDTSICSPGSADSERASTVQGALNALATARSTNTPTAATAPCSTQTTNGSAGTPEKQTPQPCLTSTCSAADFRAKVSALLAAGVDSATQEAPCSLNSPAWLKRGTLRICCLKTYPACLTMTQGERLRPSSIRWTDWGMVWNGKCLTARITASRKPGADCILSDILTDDVPERYFLSPNQQERLLCKYAPGVRASGSTPPKE